MWAAHVVSCFTLSGITAKTDMRRLLCELILHIFLQSHAWQKKAKNLEAVQ